MNKPGQAGSVDTRLRGVQLVIVALVIGIVLFAGIVVFLHVLGPAPFTPNSPIVSSVALGHAALILAVRPLALSVVEGAGRKKLLATGGKVASGLLNLFASRTIMGAAFLESAAFMFLIAYLLEGPIWTLAGGLVFAALLAALHFPTRDRVERWIERQRDALELERVGG